MTSPTTVVTIDTGLLTDIQRFGGADVSACFSCGNCTAICPLSANDGTFPRRMIRYGQVGMKDALLSSKELWTCYHCGRCSKSCPQQADPGGYMAAARRYAIANYDRTRLARALYTKPVLSSFVSILVAAVLATLLYASHGYESSKTLALFNFIPDQTIHWTGVAVFVVAFIAVLSGLTMMVRGIARAEGVHLSTIVKGRSANVRALRAAWTAVGVESLGQRRYRNDCSEDHEPEPWYRRRSILHEATMWGFLGLLVATMLDYGLALTGVKKTGTPVPIWYPVRLLGTVAGIAMVLGVSMLILNRLQHVSEAVKVSTQSDWSLLIMLWVIGVSGLALELGLYMSNAPAWGYWVFLFHVSVALEFILLTPFMKFAHVIYRPVALFFLALAGDVVK